MNELCLFAGAGGGLLGSLLLGWKTVCAVELEPYAQGVLLARQNDGFLEPFPIWDDVRSFDGRGWKGLVDVVSGGFPCQDISTAGGGAGIEGERSGLWTEMARIIGEVGPAFVLVENVPALTGRGLGRVLGDLASLGFDAVWGVFSAADAGAPHRRERIWILAYSHQIRPDSLGTYKEIGPEVEHSQQPKWWSPVPIHLRPFVESFHPTTGDGIGRVDDGLAQSMDRLGAIGNGQVPAVVVRAWKELIKWIEENKED